MPPNPEKTANRYYSLNAIESMGLLAQMRMMRESVRYFRQLLNPNLRLFVLPQGEFTNFLEQVKKIPLQNSGLSLSNQVTLWGSLLYAAAWDEIAVLYPQKVGFYSSVEVQMLQAMRRLEQSISPADTTPAAIMRALPNSLHIESSPICDKLSQINITDLIQGVNQALGTDYPTDEVAEV